MQAIRRLQALASGSLESVHAARAAAVFAAVDALIRGGDVAVSRLGRAIALGTGAKHGIKRVDRLYANDALWSERIDFYRVIARAALSAHGAERPVVLVDWTEAGPTSCVLAAAVPASGRAIVVYSEAHPLSSYTNRAVEAAFLLRLRDVLPAGVRPIVVTDAGFRAPWLRAVVAMGWDYVARIRGRTRVRAERGDAWVPYTTLYPRGRLRQAIDLGQHDVTRYKPYRARLVVYRGRRKWKPLAKAIAQRANTRAVECAKEPWLLSTSLPRTSAKKVVKLYAHRMQIEQTFRDAKSDRFGWGMGRTASRSPKRFDIMMLLMALASLVIFAVGRAAEASGLHRVFQANTIRKRRVLALTTLGRLVILHPRLALTLEDEHLRCVGARSRPT